METSTGRDLDAELAMWTNVQFPEESYFNPDRDTASRSRHKSINPSGITTSGHDALSSGLSFFGNVGAAALHERGATDSSHHAQHERAKSLQIQSLNELFSSWNGGNTDVIFGEPVVDPFLGGMGFNSAPSTDAVDNGLHPLTVRDARELQARQASQTLRTIDPSTTSLTPPAKKAKLSRRAASIDATFSGVDDNSLAGMHYQSSATLSQTSSLDHSDPTGANSSTQAQSTQEEGAGVSATEDKRRRNTLASARFRLKKKEREVAMEKKAKELDDKVTDLERECESLRKENQWLKGLVVGATTGENGLLSGALSGSSAHSASGSSNTTTANAVDLEEHIRILKANGFQVTGAGGIASSTGKRKRNAATDA
jgi:hypothetical protein